MRIVEVLVIGCAALGALIAVGACNSTLGTYQCSASPECVDGDAVSGGLRSEATSAVIEHAACGESLGLPDT